MNDDLVWVIAENYAMGREWVRRNCSPHDRVVIAVRPRDLQGHTIRPKDHIAYVGVLDPEFLEAVGQARVLGLYERQRKAEGPDLSSPEKVLEYVLNNVDADDN